MRAMREQHLSGLDALEAVTTLLQRARLADPTAGSFDAGEVQWWWRTERSTDVHPQLFWFDHLGRPEAAVLATDWDDRVGLDPVVMPGTPAAWIEAVMERGLAHAADAGFSSIALEVDRNDHHFISWLTDRGFVGGEDGLVETWLPADARPPVSPLHEGYRLFRRSETLDRPHHMAAWSGRDEEPRLRQTSLYRDDLDLVVHDADGSVAAYGLFWFDPVTLTGVVEPMRTLDAHQGRGLARHVLTSGIDLLTAAGAERVKICFETGNPAAEHLYLSVGFQPVRQTVVLTRRSGDDVSS